MIGFAGGDIPKIALNLPLLKGCAVVDVFWGDFVRREPDDSRRDLAALAELYLEKRICSLVSGCYSLEQTGDALRALVQRQVKGKMLIIP